MRLLRTAVLAASAFALSGFALSGCGSFGPTPSLATACVAFTFEGGPVLGDFHITPEQTWLDGDDGRHLSVVWPEEVEIRPDGLYSRETGERMVRDGERLQLIQTEWTSAAGTPADPYRPGWCSFYGVF